MAKEKEREREKGWLRNRVYSLRVQVGLMVLLSYLIPVALLGFFTGSILLGRLEEKTEAAVTSSAEHAFAMTEQNISRTVDLARDATYDGELTAAWEKWNSGAAGDADRAQAGRRVPRPADGLRRRAAESLRQTFEIEQISLYLSCYGEKKEHAGGRPQVL